MSNAPPSARASIDSHIWRESPKTTMETPNPATTTKSIGPARRRIGKPASASAARNAPTAGAARRTARARRADLEDVLREDREQRDRAAEEHREEVERDRSEEHPRPTDQANAREHLAEPATLAGRGHPPAAKRETPSATSESPIPTM